MRVTELSTEDIQDYLLELSGKRFMSQGQIKIWYELQEELTRRENIIKRNLASQARRENVSHNAPQGLSSHMKDSAEGKKCENIHPQGC